ncbi:hypothetical protein H6P81_012499 [Aristolochia fimbriata]|uniref:Uncharacterized protein n=1 Tax=Aristolochia fimbriata TaxID=158543 RepID=A0AAV7EF32_ARIFI|nr:hypothetical protein H6P81_012499 [Aristolochia fimbriata]
MKGMKDKLDNISIMNRELIVKLNESEASQKFLQLDVMKRDELLKLQEKQIEELQKELNSIKLILKNLEKGKGKLDEILSSGKPSGDKRGLGYGGSTPRTQTVFVKEGCVQGGVPDGVPHIDSEKDDRCFEFLEGTLSMCVV